MKKPSSSRELSSFNGLTVLPLLAGLTLLCSCDSDSRSEAEKAAEHASNAAQEAAEKAKAEVHKAGDKVKNAVNDALDRRPNEEIRDAAEEAAKKLDDAAAKLKDNPPN